MRAKQRKQLEWSARAAAQLLQIKEYIAADNPAAAQRVVREILRTAEQLTDFPMLGHPGRRSGTREILIPRHPWFIAYRVTAAKVSVLAVLHQARRYP